MIRHSTWAQMKHDLVRQYPSGVPEEKIHVLHMLEENIQKEYEKLKEDALHENVA